MVANFVSFFASKFARIHVLAHFLLLFELWDEDAPSYSDEHVPSDHDGASRPRRARREVDGGSFTPLQHSKSLPTRRGRVRRPQRSEELVRQLEPVTS